MSWLDDIFGQTPNAVGDARAKIEPTIAQYRGANGSLDPNAIRDMLPKEVQGEADLQLKLAEMRRQAVDAYKPEPLKWNQWAGGALQAASIPFGYGTGNPGYAQAMLGNTILDKHIARNNAYADDAAKMRLDVTDKSLTGIGDSAIQYMQKKREKIEAARQMVAKTIAVAQIRGGPAAQAQATKSGAAYLRSLGLNAEADQLEKAGAPAPVSSTPSPAPVTSSVPGIAVAPQMPPVSAGGGPVAPPSPQSAAPVPVQAAPMPQTSPPNIISPKREIANQIRPYDEDAAKALDKEAEIDETGPLEGVKETAKKSAEAAVKLRVDQPQETKALQTTMDTLDGVEKSVDELLTVGKDGKPNLTSGAASNVGGLWDSYVPNMPGGQAANAWANISKLKSNIGVMVLNAMREASKTGGAVGNVTEKEWPILQSQLAALDPNMSDDAFAQSLMEIKTRLNKMRLSSASAYDNTYGTDYAQRLSAPETDAKAQTDPSPVSAGAPLSQAKIGTRKMFKDGVERIKVEGGWARAEPEKPATPTSRVGSFRNPRGS